MMASCELSNLGLELDDKIKENEQLAGELGAGEETFLPEQRRGDRDANKEEQKKENWVLEVFFIPSVFVWKSDQLPLYFSWMKRKYNLPLGPNVSHCLGSFYFSAEL